MGAEVAPSGLVVVLTSTSTTVCLSEKILEPLEHDVVDRRDVRTMKPERLKVRDIRDNRRTHADGRPRRSTRECVVFAEVRFKSPPCMKEGIGRDLKNV